MQYLLITYEREGSSRRPDGHCLKAVDAIRNKFASENEYLIFDYCDGSDGGIPFVMKSSARKVELLLNLDKDGIHCLSTEAVFLDVLHSKVFIAFLASVNISKAYPS